MVTSDRETWSKVGRGIGEAEGAEVEVPRVRTDHHSVHSAFRSANLQQPRLAPEQGVSYGDEETPRQLMLRASARGIMEKNDGIRDLEQLA